MAEVYLATLTGAGGFEKRVALKKILPIYSDLDDFAQLFQDEARICSALDHTNIVQVFDYGEVGGEHYIAMEFVDGPDLEKVLQGARKLEHKIAIDTVLYIGTRVAGALDHAHRQCDERGRPMRLVHRDVSPGNVLLAVHGDVKITDFGVARFADKAVRSQAGVIRGKYAYMSPEQVQGGDVDHRSDIFALGIVLYEMASLQNPFAAPADFQTMEQIVAGRYRPLHEVRPDVPRDLSRIVSRCMQPRPADRYDDADSVRRELAALMFSRGVIDEPPVLVDELFRLFPKQLQRRGVAGRASTSSVALPAVGAPRMRGGDPGEGPRPTKPAPAARRRTKLLGPDDGRDRDELYDEDDLTQPQLGNPDAIPTQPVGVEDEGLPAAGRSISDPFAPMAPKFRKDGVKLEVETVRAGSAEGLGAAGQEPGTAPPGAPTFEDLDTGRAAAVPADAGQTTGEHLETLDLDQVSGSVPSVPEAGAERVPPHPASSPLPSDSPFRVLGPGLETVAEGWSISESALDAGTESAAAPISAAAKELLTAMENSLGAEPQAPSPDDFGGLDPPSAIGLAAIRLGAATGLDAGRDRIAGESVAPSPAVPRAESPGRGAEPPAPPGAGPLTAPEPSKAAPVVEVRALSSGPPPWAVETTHPTHEPNPEVSVEAGPPVSTHGATLEYPSATPIHAPVSVASGLPAVRIPDPLPDTAADVPGPAAPDFQAAPTPILLVATAAAEAGGAVDAGPAAPLRLGQSVHGAELAAAGVAGTEGGPPAADTATAMAAIGAPKRKKKKKKKAATGFPWVWSIAALVGLILVLGVLRARQEPPQRLARTAMTDPKAPAVSPDRPRPPATAATPAPPTPSTAPLSGSSASPVPVPSPTPTPPVAPAPTPTSAKAEPPPPRPTPTPAPATPKPAAKEEPRTRTTPPPAAAASPAEGKPLSGIAVTLRSEPPGAALIVNGRAVGKAPWVGSVQAGAVIEVTARLPGHLSTTRMLKVSDRPMEASVQLTPVSAASGEGTVQITSEPWGYVYVDGRETGKVTPVRLTLSAGPHEIRIENPELSWSEKRSVTVEAGKDSTVRVER